MSVILYRYDGSPFGAKVESMLAVKRIPAAHVDVAPLLPRPELSELLGLGYRRIPVLAIGRNLYCDTSLIASVLERRFPTSGGYGTLFPKRRDGSTTDTGLVKAFAQFYADSALFPTAVPFVPWDKVPAAFLADRSKTLVEEQLQDGRQWLFDTETPGLADLSVFFVLNWARSLPGTSELFGDKVKFAKTLEWLRNVQKYIQSQEATLPKTEKISGKEAAQRIASAAAVEREKPLFDEKTATLLGVKHGEPVAVIPEDNSRDYPTKGLLVGLSDEEVVLEIKGKAGTFLCHFPRLRYAVVAGKAKEAKL
ncbi:hypothetical protein K523DRAFT_339697 [Schizophyllum commune Tattone D]|nr:hypothetical protein K523DRAFT_339697 [Schizophyllum commune Tattone D]